MPHSNVVTRFAPSPTGYLHIGGARTALFNWLFARHHGGQFLLRIEDTDRERHSEDAVQAILDGLSWLGLDADQAPISQFERAARHREVAEQLLDSGHAYRCWLSGDALSQARDQAREKGERFESPWRDAKDEGPLDQPHSIRFRAPKDGETRIKDSVQGDVTFPNSALDDLVIVRSGEAGPTYNLAVVVDDHDMAVTHIIRGDDHLINAARQQQIYQALDWPVPVWAHVPLIHGPDGKKLSKRHGALGVEAWRDDGYLADGLVNYLLKLGWAHGDEEIIPRDKAIALFGLDGLNKAPARLDFDKLAHINAHYIQAMGDAAFLAAAAPFIEKDAPITGPALERFQRATPFVKARVSTLTAIPAAAMFTLIERPLEITGKAAKPLKKDGAKAMIESVAHALNEVDWTDPQGLDAALQDIADDKGVGFGQVGPPIRAALTAGHPAPTLGETLYSLGREESLGRLNDALRTL